MLPYYERKMSNDFLPRLFVSCLDTRPATNFDSVISVYSAFHETRSLSRPLPHAQWDGLIGARLARSVWSSGLASRRMRRTIGKVANTFVLLKTRDVGGAETRVAKDPGLLERYDRGAGSGNELRSTTAMPLPPVPVIATSVLSRPLETRAR